MRREEKKKKNEMKEIRGNKEKKTRDTRRIKSRRRKGNGDEADTE